MRAALASLAAASLALTLPAQAGTGGKPVVPAEPDGMLVLALLSPERAMVADPRTGATSARELPGGTLCHGPLLVAGGRMLLFGVSGRRVVPRSLPLERHGPAVSLGPADTALASSEPGRVWLGRWTGLGEQTGRMSLSEVSVDGRVIARSRWLLARWDRPVAVVDGGLLISRDRGLVLRRPGRSRVLFRGGWPLAAADDRFAWHRRGSRLVRVWSGEGERSFDPPGRLRPDVTSGAAFSPAGRRLALAVTARGRSRVAVIDLERGAWRFVRGGRLAGYKAIAWSPSGRWLYFTRGERVLASRGGTEPAVRLPIRAGGTVMSIAVASTPASPAP